MTMKTITTAKRNKWFWMYLLVLLAVGIMPWTTRGANCPKYFCDNNGAYSCPASPFMNCWSDGCDVCDRGCPTQGPFQQKKCVADNSGGMTSCDPVYSFCNTGQSREIVGCTLICCCPLYGWSDISCVGMWQSACK
jgi:hypothetical protein